MFTLTKILSLFVYPLSLGLFFVGLSLWGQLRGMVLMNTDVVVQGLAEAVVDGEKRVLFQALNSDGQPAVANGIVCGRA